jgi:methionyl-tRNA formyltransferase
MKLFFLGSGHGGVAAFKSLQNVCSCVEVISSDPSIRMMLRSSDILRSELSSVEAPVGVMAGNLEILPAMFLSTHCVLNVHYSVLPRYRGLHSVVWAMLNLDPEYGLTVHLTNDRIDDGPIVYQYKHPYTGETSFAIMSHLNEVISAKLGNIVSDFLEGKTVPVPQDNRFATWVPRRNLNDCLFPFGWPSPRLRAFLLALVRPYPLPAVIAKSVRYEISIARIVDREYFAELGRVVNVDNEGAWVKCQDSLLVIEELTDPVGKTTSAAKTLRLGQRLKGAKS